MDAAPAAGTPRLLFKGRDRLAACAADVPALILRDAFGAAAEDARRLVLFEHNAVIVHIYFQRGVLVDIQYPARSAAQYGPDYPPDVRFP